MTLFTQPLSPAQKAAATKRANGLDLSAIARHARDTFNARQARLNNPMARALIKRLRIVGA